jgi:outer membrane receptor protein involved in Fe transport
VNIILKRDFEGVEIGANYGESAEGDAGRQNYEITLGSNLEDGRGNIAVSFGYTKVDPLTQDQRPIGKFSLSSTTGAVQGSNTATPVVFGSPGLIGQIDPTSGAIVPLIGGIAPIPYNFQPQNYYQTGLDRYQATALGHYAVTDRLEAYSNVMYARSDVASQIAASGSFLNNYAVPIGNPFIPAAARTQICTWAAIPAANCVAGNPQEVTMALGRRFEELGPRIQRFENSAFQLTMGLRGDISEHWSFDTYWSYGEGEQTRTRDNWGSLSRLQQALRATNPNTCTVTTNGCVPFNIFGNLGSITPQILNFVNLDALTRTNTDQKVFEGFVSGDLGDFKLPWTSDPIGIAAGVETRNVGAGNFSDGSSQLQGEVLGTGAPTPDRTGTLKLDEIFAEIMVPLVSDKTLLRDLTLEAGIRSTDFEVTGGNSQSFESYKFGGEWSPFEPVRFRFMRQRATRAPNINELFQPVVSGLQNLAVDPCGGAAINQGQANTAGTISNLCLLTGVPFGAIGSLPQPSAGQINVRTGGNPALGPEEADTETIGFVLQPLENLTISVDYYDIEINAAISQPTSSDVLTDCYSTARNPGFVFNAACAQVLRDPINGTFNGATAPGVVLPLSNVGFYATDGYDLGATYRLGLDNAGDLTFTLNANFVESWKFQATQNSVLRDCLGFYSVACDNATTLISGPRPETMFTQTTRWVSGNFDLALTWRNIASLIEEPGGTNFLAAFAAIPEYDYFDLGFGWNATEKLRLNFSVLNLTDEDAPNVGQTIGGTGNNSGNSYPQSYDTIGQYMTLGIDMRF